MKVSLIWVVVFLMSFVAYVRYLEKTTIFHPTRLMERTPRSVGLDFEDISFRTKDNVLIHGWLVKHPQGRCTLLYFHGNAGNISDRLEKISLLRKVGVHIFIIDYRGYGQSQGRPSEQGLYEDALGAYDYLLTRKDIEPDKIGAYGTSLGGAVAVDLATKRKLACLVIDSSFTKAADISKTIYPFIPSFLIQTKMDSVRKIKNLAIPKFFIHSPQDEVIPYRLGRKLFEQAPEPKEFLDVRGGHNDNYEQSAELLESKLSDFLRRYGLIGKHRI